MRLAVSSACLFVLVACGGSPDSKTADAPRGGAAGTASPGGPSGRAPVRQLRRADVKKTIERGLGVFLQNVAVEDYPAMKQGRFYGFRLKALNPDWAIDLRPGDVIVKVNGQVIEHPEEADAALRSLEKAPALKIDYDREGKLMTLELPIVD